jgi:ATP-dependent Clp protease protease subunit
VYLTGEVMDDMALDIISKLQFLGQYDAPIYIYINTCGGSIDAGMSIVEHMKLIKPKIYTIIAGSAFSMGAVISLFGDKGCRFITPGSSFMLHPAQFEMEYDYVDQQKRAVDFIHKTDDAIYTAISKRVKIGKKKLRKICDKGLWLNAKDCVEQGFCDGIWTPKLEKEVNLHAAAAKKTKKEQFKMIQAGQLFKQFVDAVVSGDYLEDEDCGEE